jgi:hypothetical protein
MVASINVLPPVKAARCFEGYDRDVMRPSTLVLCAVRLHSHVSLPHGTLQWRNYARLRRDS